MCCINLRSPSMLRRSFASQVRAKLWLVEGSLIALYLAFDIRPIQHQSSISELARLRKTTDFTHSFDDSSIDPGAGRNVQRRSRISTLTVHGRLWVGVGLGPHRSAVEYRLSSVEAQAISWVGDHANDHIYETKFTCVGR